MSTEITKVIAPATTPADLTAENLPATVESIRAQGFPVDFLGLTTVRDGLEYVVVGPLTAISAESDKDITLTVDEMCKLEQLDGKTRLENAAKAIIGYGLNINSALLTLNAIRMAFMPEDILFGDDGKLEAEFCSDYIQGIEGGLAYLQQAMLLSMFD